jgi:NADH:ubiquinone oxidoreductase subunit F (NADH-binding)
MKTGATMAGPETGTGPSGTDRLFAAGEYAGFSSHLHAYGPLAADQVAPGLIEELEASGLTGRGGAAFPVWQKMAAVATGHSAVVVANGAEGEPLSFKDQMLLQHAPHLVIDGLLAAAAAVRAGRLYLYTGESGLAPVQRAMAERSDARKVRIVHAPDTFVAGEASAVVNAFGTGTALPLDRTRRLTETGLHGRPTLVHNVETLAHIGLIARFGADWFRSAGTGRDPGTRLISVSGDVAAATVLEVPGDAPVEDILRAAGTEPASLSAVLAGGYHGQWTGPSGANLSASGPEPQTIRPGAGVLFALGRHHCGLDATAQIVRYLASQSVRQCGPCRFGLPALATAWEQLAAGEGSPRLPPELQRLGLLAAGRGACHHPDGTVRMAASALELFAPDVRLHLAGRCNRQEAAS